MERVKSEEQERLREGLQERAGAPYQELGQAVRPEGNSLRSGLSTRGPKLGSSCSLTLGKSLGLSFPVCKMESTCPIKAGLPVGWSAVYAVFGVVLGRDRISPE